MTLQQAADAVAGRGSCVAEPAGDERVRLRLTIRGVVQGVGFRPLVYRLACEMALPGWVINDARGLVIEVEGRSSALGHFIERLRAETPPHAVIHQLTAEWAAAAGHARFEIRKSADGGGKSAAVLPDLATCPQCLSEILDPADRHYRYPFTNCTRCGPRFTILRALPYDRPNTTMRAFALCPECRAEYGDPGDRRFHAQPTACPACGPKLALWAREGGGWAEAASGDKALRRAADALRQGAVVAVKGLGGFHLLADAANGDAIARLRERKHRPLKPFAVMVADTAAARLVCDCPPEAAALLRSAAAPIVLLPRLGVVAGGECGIDEGVAPGNPTLGLMLPANPLHHLLMREIGRPVVATSGNLSDEPICIDETEATDRLGAIADLFLVHDRPIVRHMDDSVVQMVAGAPRVLRRARGYAPLPIPVARPLPPILAVGAHLKNAVALSVGDQVFVSQHIGDLETPQATAAFERVIEDFLALYEVKPRAIAGDLHPDYRSSRWAARAAERLGAEIVFVQHHHAHLAACLIENGVEGEALGVVWDGTGYGTDGRIWGGEFLLGDAGAVRRVAHLRPFRLPGGDAAAREPRRTALALLYEAYGEAAFEWEDLPPVAAFEPRERRVLATMLGRGVNAPETTSMGRLFDGVAAMAGLHQRVGFEGQAAMALQFAVASDVEDAYPFDLCGPEAAGGAMILDWRPMLAAVIGDVRKQVGPGVVAARFHNGLVGAMLAVARATGNPRVALSGGCFQNRVLVERGKDRLEHAGFEVVLHRQVPPNDGGISLGQIAVAAARLEDTSRES